jgi:polysaccharide deacetylase family protein (PEP-CTERM system associated)
VNPVTTEIINAMSVDVEDYFQVSAFEKIVSPQEWDHFESRVEANTDRMLRLFDDVGVRATFFVLGWVAERYPGLVRRIAAQGHEIASHSYAHRLVYELTPDEFRADLRRAKTAIEAAAGTPVLGYRAPSYSVVARSTWALEILAEEGYAYDASIFPIRHDRYGIPDAPRHIHRIDVGDRSIVEVPGSTVRYGGVNLPIAGGGYFRILPYQWTRWGIRHLNRRESRPAVFYIHPWEIDPDQPRLPGSRMSRARHYRNLSKTEERLKRLLRDFRFGPIEQVLRLQDGVVAPARQASDNAGPGRPLGEGAQPPAPGPAGPPRYRRA